MTDVKHYSMGSDQYRNRYRKALSTLKILAIAAIALLTVLFVVNKSTPSQKFYATTMGGQVVPLQPLSIPVVSNDFITQWASLAVRQAYNLDFVKYQDQLAGAKKYFTNSGWESFQGALDHAGVIKTITDQKLISTAAVTGPVVIDNFGVVAGRYVWKIRMPLLITYGSASESAKQKLTVSMIVMRVPSLDSPQGIEINNFETSARGDAS